MSQRDSFAGGFVLGAIVGGIAGGIVGAVLTSQRSGDQENRLSLKSGRGGQLEGEESMEMARRTLEDKIAQLNHAIDDVRDQLGAVNSRKEKEMP